MLPASAMFSAHGYVPQAVDFDGANDYLTRGGLLTGVSDGKQLTGSFWIRANTSLVIFMTASDAGASPRVYLGTRGGTNFVLEGRNAAGDTRLDINSTASIITGAWTHVMFSVDLTDTAKRHIYIDDTSDLNVVAYIDDNIDFTFGQSVMGASKDDGTFKYDFDIADFWLDYNRYVDFSVEANRRLFVGPGGQPVDLGPDGSLPFGTAPIIYLSGPASNWHVNKGMGGGFTLHGALTGARSNPG